MTDESANSTETGRRPRGRPRDPGVEARRREELLAAAARVFAFAGFAATDVQAIATVAGVGKGTVYRYFKTKEELFLAALDQGLTELAAVCTAAVANPRESVLVRLAKLIRAYLDFFASRPEMVELFVQERATFRGRQQALYFAEFEGDPRHAGLEAFLAELLASGLLRPISPDDFHAVVGDALFGTVVANALSNRPADPATQADLMTRVLFRGLFVRPEEEFS